MTQHLGAICDDFYINCRLYLKLDMSLEHEAVLHFFDRVRKDYPGLRKLRRRDRGAFTLEEESDAEGSRRWLRLEPNGLRFGHFAPTDPTDVRAYGDLILTQAPYHLTLSDLVYDHMEVVYGFDLRYRGNHDRLIAETLLGDHAASGFLLGDHASHVIDAHPYFGVALSAECDLQAYVEIKPRTTTYEVRAANYEGESLSVYLTLRKYWGLAGDSSPAVALQSLCDAADELAVDKIVPAFVNPLAAAIASRP